MPRRPAIHSRGCLRLFQLISGWENFTQIWGNFYAFSLGSALGWSLLFRPQCIENDIIH
jgi:hypothetical protein